jgi:hypothetical protein
MNPLYHIRIPSVEKQTTIFSLTSFFSCRYNPTSGSSLRLNRENGHGRIITERAKLNHAIQASG